MDRRRLLRAALVGGLGVAAGCTPERQQRAGKQGRVISAPPAADDETASLEAPDDAPADASGDDRPPATDRPDRAIEVICRDAVGLLPVAGSDRPHTIRRVMLHHTGVPLGDNADVPALLRRHQSHHLDLGWQDIAYHYAVDLAGNVYELRDPTEAGETSTDYDPAGHLLLVCEGNYESQEPSDAMLTSLAQLIAFGAERYGARIDTLMAHRDVVPTTACPGDALLRRRGELQAEATAIMEASRPEVALLCGEEGRRRVAEVEAA